jgi:transcriptional regulator with XRE-family HTH domain
MDLGLLQKDVARQIGLNKDTIHNWEMNRTVPEVRVIPKVIDFLGYAPYDPAWTFGRWLRAVRSTLGLSQEQLAKRAGLDESTIAKWEREERRPLGIKLRVLQTFLRRQA